jgi:hypothetical protein
MKLRRGIVGLLILMLLLAFPVGGAAQVDVTYSEITANHTYGEEIIFEAEIATNQPITFLELIFKPTERDSIVVPVSVSNGNHLTANYQINPQDSFAPFVEITYWFVANLQSGGQVQSEPQVFIYSDNRYTWQTLDYGVNFHAHWIEGDTGFGQAILDAAVNSLTRFEQYLTLPIPESLDIYVYPSANALQGALEASGTGWITGQADPRSNRVFAAVPNSFDRDLDIENVIPHEVTHIRLALLMGNNFSNLPAWLNEGIATLSERYATSDWTILEAAQQNDDLLKFSELCSTFPGSNEGAGLAYAQSESFVRYIFQEYGKIGLEALVDVYIQGNSCENGVSAGLGVSLESLEDEWFRETFNQIPPLEGDGGLYGWGLFGIAAFIGPLVLILFNKRKRDEQED